VMTQPSHLTPFGFFSKLTKEAQGEKIKKHKEMVDYDSFAIPHAARYILEKLGIQKSISAIVIGQNNSKVAWDFRSQFREALEQGLHKESDFILFSYPANEQKHSVAVVIDRNDKKIYVIDSQNNEYSAITETIDALKKVQKDEIVQKEEKREQENVSEEAKKDSASCMTKSAINLIKDFTVVKPQFKRAPQQDAEHKTVCGEYSIRNMVATVLHLTGTDPHPSLTSLITPLNPETGLGYVPFATNKGHEEWIGAIECALDEASKEKSSTRGLSL
jgi:hypothetical protein